MESPRLCFYDEDIKEYTGKSISDFKIGDELDLNIRVKVKGVEQREDYAGPVGVGSKKEPEKKLVSRLDLEVVGEKKKPLFKPESGRIR